MTATKSGKHRTSKVRLLQAGLLAATLGLAPFVPEPHIWGKLKWIIGGAEGMQLMDWFDVILHGAPWLFLVWQVVLLLKKRLT